MKIFSHLNKILLLIFSILLITSEIKAQLTTTVTTSDYNGYEVSCFGEQDGSISVSVTGGTPPYNFEWSNAAGNTAVLTDLPAGYYHAHVYDNNNNYASVEITLHEPENFKVTVEPFVYPNGFNTTCYFCSNGSVTVTPINGVLPITYLWGDGNNVANRTGMPAGDYTITSTDNNGCIYEVTIGISAPERDDWTMNGNTGSNTNNYIGTADSRDFIFKTNSTTRMTIGSTGTLKINSLSGTGTDIVFTDNQGNLLRGPQFLPYWGLGGNIGVTSSHYIGTRNNEDLIFKTNVDAQTPPCGMCGEGMRIKSNGQIAIGTNTISGNQILTVTGNTYFNGKIGVGTNAPNADLQVENNGTSDVRIDVFNSYNTGGLAKNALIRVMNSLYSYGIGIDENAYGHIFDGANKVISFKNQEIGIGSNPIAGLKLSVTGSSYFNGNVGIGTSSPTGNLEVKGTNSRIYITDDNASPASLNLKNGNGFWHLSGPRAETNNPFSIFWSSDDITFNRYLTVLDNGNVGIGYEMPDAKLVVSSGASQSEIKLNNTTNNPSTFWALNSLYSYGFGAKTHSIGGEGKTLGHIYSNVASSDIVMTFTNDKKVGIGNITSIVPKEALQIGDWITIHDGGKKVFGYNFAFDGLDKRMNDGNSSAIYFSPDGSMEFRTAENDLAETEITWHNGLKINSMGNIGMGSDPDDDYKLVVEGKIGASEMRLTLTRPWPDYVFKEEYELMPIKQLKSFVTANKHLPGLDNASCIESEKGYDVGGMQVKLLEKVEELTLYIIQINEQNNLLKQKITELENKIK